MKHAAGPRREIGVRTVFNVLGPLTNPAGASAQVLGVFSRDLVPKLAGVLAKLGTTRAFVLHGAGGTDELTPLGPAHVCEVAGGKVVQLEIDPLNYGVKRAVIDDLKGGFPAENAAIIRAILAGEKGPRRDAVVMNASLALVAAGLAEDFAGGMQLAERSIDSGSASTKLQELAEFTSSRSEKKAIS